MFNSPETLLALAEIAVSLAGFSAIVVVLKSGVTGTWSAYDAVHFRGMVVHSAFAILFCFLPSVINVVVQDPVTSLHISSGILGAQIIVHCIAVMRMSTSGMSARMTLGIGLVFGLVPLAVFTDWGVHRELELYLIGVIWHIVQAGTLFVLLIWIPKAEISDE